VLALPRAWGKLGLGRTLRMIGLGQNMRTCMDPGRDSSEPPRRQGARGVWCERFRAMKMFMYSGCKQVIAELEVQ